MSAALALAQRGVQVQLLEARRRLGGRTGSFSLPSSEEGASETAAVDYCQHVAMGCCTNLRQFIDWLGQTDQWLEYDELHFLSSSGRYQRLRSLPWLPAPLHISHWLLRWPNLSLGDRVAVSRGMLSIQRLKLCDALESQPALPWLIAHHQTPGSLKHFWSTILVSALGAELDAVNLGSVAKVLQDGFLNHRDAYHLLVPQQPLDKLFNIDAANRLRQAGVDIVTGAQVKQIVPGSTDERVSIVAGGKTYEADTCILAVPWHALGRIVSETASASELVAIAQRAGQLQTSPITGIHTWWDRSWLQLPHVAIVGRMCQWVFAEPCRPDIDGSNVDGADSKDWYCQVVISASHSLPAGNPQRVQQLVVDELAELFPASRQAKLLRFKPVTDPQAVFSIGPNSLPLRPFTATKTPRLLLAGDWTRTGWPATMEGAVISGFRAAETFLASRGTPMTIVAPPLGGRRKGPGTPQKAI